MYVDLVNEVHNTVYTSTPMFHTVKISPRLLTHAHPIKSECLIDGDGEGGCVEVRVLQLTQDTGTHKHRGSLQNHTHTSTVLPLNLHREWDHNNYSKHLERNTNLLQRSVH